MLSIVFNIGMWIERYDIVISSLEHNDYLSSMWRGFAGTIWDWALLIGSIGAFLFLFLLFVRWVPIIPAHEMKELVDAPERQEPEPKPWGARFAPIAAHVDVWLARFESPEALLDAAHRARREGIEQLDAFTPVEVEGLHDAMGLRPSRLAWVVAGGAVASGAAAYAMQWYAATVSYEWNVGGRPLHSWPSFMPLTFELSVLGGALVLSACPEAATGEVAAGTRLRATLVEGDAPQRHVLVCLHHHPAPLQSRWLDQVGLENGNEFLALLRGFPNARAVVFGHVHQAWDRELDGLRLIATPSTGSQFKPHTDDFEVDARPPAWRTLTLQADGRIQTRLNWLEGWTP